MKYLLTTIISGLALIGATVSSLAQGGTVTWNNYINPNSNNNTPVIYGNGPNAGSLVAGPTGTYEYGLYVGPLGSTSISQMTLVSTCFNFKANFGNGMIVGGDVTLPGGYPDGTTIADLVAGWTAADGGDYLTAIANNPDDYAGLSALGSVTPGRPPPSVFGVFGGGEIPGFSLEEMPEPVTLALGGLGIAGVLLFRRRKK